MNVSSRQGCNFHLRQIRTTVANDIPNWSPSKRLDQCVTPSSTGGQQRRSGDHELVVHDRPARPRQITQRAQAALQVPVRQFRTVGPEAPT